MKTNPELSQLVTQAVGILEQHSMPGGLDDTQTLAQMGAVFHGHACRKAVANAGPDELSKLVRRAVNVLNEHASPEIYSEVEAMRALHFIFDGQRCRKALRVKPQARSALYTALSECATTVKLRTVPVEARIRELRIAIFLRQPTSRMHYNADENFLTLMKAIKECPKEAQS